VARPSIVPIALTLDDRTGYTLWAPPWAGVCCCDMSLVCLTYPFGTGRLRPRHVGDGTLPGLLNPALPPLMVAKLLFKPGFLNAIRLRRTSHTCMCPIPAYANCHPPRLPAH